MEMESLECSSSSSGCRSGWTVYFEQSCASPPKKESSIHDQDQDQEEEDLSMVSDASSGPPHLDTQEFQFQCDDSTPSNARKKRRVDTEKKRELLLCSSLDDTASSPLLLDCSKSSNVSSTDMETNGESVMEFSCAFSATHFKAESSLRKHTDYDLQSISSLEPSSKIPIMYPKTKVKRRFDDTFLCSFSQ